MRRSGRALVAVIVAVPVLTAAGCGRDDFENDPRPTVPAEVSVEIGEKKVSVAPSTFGAGLVNFTVANLADTSTALSIDGPIDAESEEIPPGGVTNLKADVESGQYEASAEGAVAAPFNFEVGPQRPSGQDELLLP